MAFLGFHRVCSREGCRRPKQTNACFVPFSLDLQDKAFHSAISAEVLLKESGDAEIARRLVIYNPVSWAHCKLGGLLIDLGDAAGAETAYRAAIAADPLHAEAHHKLGFVLFARGDFEGAARLFAIALRALRTTTTLTLVGNSRTQDSDMLRVSSSYLQRAIRALQKQRANSFT